VKPALAGLLIALAACQDNIATPFPDGLDPLEDNVVPPADTTDEVLRTQTVNSPDFDNDVHGRGLVLVDPATLWALSQMPPAMIARCSTDSQSVMLNDDPTYMFSFLVHYVVNDILTVEWDDAWRYGIVVGTADAPALGMIRHQKTMGSDFIHLSEGTVEVIATDDPAISELAFVEHLSAASGSPGDLVAGMKANYDALVALAHGQPIPHCP
jgi:hypothetical protein